MGRVARSCTCMQQNTFWAPITGALREIEHSFVTQWERLPLRSLEQLTYDLSLLAIESLFRFEKKTVYVETTPYHCLITGNPEKPTLVWLHGFADSKYTFAPTALRLKKDFHIVIPDLPGFDGTPFHPTVRHDLNYYTATMAKILQQLGVCDAILVGNSLGGAIALQLALEHPHLVRQVIPVNSAGVVGDELTGFYAELLTGANLFHVNDYDEFETFLSRIFHRRAPMPIFLKIHLYHEFRHNGPWYNKIMGDLTHGLFGAKGMKEARNYKKFALDDRLPEIHKPVHVIWGDRDTLFPLRLGEETARAIPGADFTMIRNCGHCPHMEQPFKLAELIRKVVIV